MTGRGSSSGWSPQGPVDELTDDQSWALLGTASFGRLAVSVGNRPEIFPIDFRVDRRSVVFRTAMGTKLDDLILNEHVAIETDEVAGPHRWSVVVNGTARILSDPDEVSAADRLPFPAWIPTSAFSYVRITPTSVRGRRFERGVVLVVR